MKKLIASAALMAAALAPFAAAADDDDDAMDRRSQQAITLAVFGDWPYSTALLQSAQTLIHSINADAKVSLILHVGDIHSGSMPCTGAGLNPVPAGSQPGWNQEIFNLFEQLRDPFVYTPGDNEWTDCHKTKELSSGAPLNELAAVRSLFFANPGTTLGVHKTSGTDPVRRLRSDHPSDAQFVENVMWERLASGVRDGEHARLEQRRPALDGAVHRRDRAHARSGAAHRRRDTLAAGGVFARGAGRCEGRGHRPAGGHVGSRRSGSRRRRTGQLHALRARAGATAACTSAGRCCSSTATRTCSAADSRSPIPTAQRARSTAPQPCRT